jgi:hypothetical protein
MAYGERKEFLEKLKAQGKNTPGLDSKPPLLGSALFYFSVFMNLSGSRPFSSGGQAMPIPVSEILSFCVLMGVNSLTERHRIWHFTKTCDKVFLETSARKHKRAESISNPKSGSGLQRGGNRR